jgi:hypothetical protein
MTQRFFRSVSRKDGRKPNGYWNDFENIQKVLLPICKELQRMPSREELNGLGFHERYFNQFRGKKVVANILGYEEIELSEVVSIFSNIQQGSPCSDISMHLK